MLKNVLRGSVVQAGMACAVGAYLNFALRSTRWTLVGDVYLAPPVAGVPVIVAFWHNRLSLLPVLWFAMRRKGARGIPRVLVSRHRDGRFIAAVVRQFGVRAVHGSSSKNSTARDIAEKGGVSSVRILLGILEAGDHVLITPDGPRGPSRRAARGVAQIAGLSGAPVLPIGAQTSWRYTLATWDRMVVPLPFGRGVLVCGAPIPVSREGWEASLLTIESALNAVADEADRLCSR